MTGDDLRKHVLVWLVEDHNLRPEHAWRIEVAKRLVCDDMQLAWDELAKQGATDGRHIMSFVFDAAEDAHRECVRLTSKEESGRIADVADALDTLREAIASTPSPGRDNPQLTPFVRHLADHFEKRYGGKLMATVARIAATTYGDPVTQKQVERILHTQPQ
jgi:hypothetical protein